ncbi:Restriction endonuclease, type I, EcoRI, R subunit/Type III [Natronococcus amylolyticus DSM 10524]|uniref:Restriction endonuclease, type I, EcoRI, R subunit/Type III n=1 Tax=Natronococcus amylolyticus DSM 10524 TaxID=1227497 RepID=L9XLC9_9EURY|nr:type I restriction enzyme HsdR N-terminal domain-containing protein [Natronococcus amylolyticus]ELY61468.1 Restriction endonuclease, type I, EcoRI, R subunit/Type III [Natronococcus amylolyticus DSM 10524]
MDETEVAEYARHSQTIIDDAPQMDEANTKAAVLRDFLDLLGWEIPANTKLEYSVKVGTRSYKVDYALLLEGAPVAFFEAKGVDTALSSNHREQLGTYMKNENVNWGILSNGKQYQFLRREVVDTNVKVQVLAEADLKRLPEQITILRAFTKDAIQAGDSEKIANRIEELKAARTSLEKNKDDLSTAITEILTEDVSDTISTLAEPRAKEMIDDLVQEIDAEINTDRTRSQSEEVDTSSVETDGSDEQGYIVKIHNGGETLTTFSDTVQSDVMAGVVNYLLENYDLSSEIEPLPYIPGRKKAIINDEPSSPHDEQAMRNHRELSGGHYLDTHMSGKNKKRYLQRFAEMCGLDASFAGEW